MLLGCLPPHSSVPLHGYHVIRHWMFPALLCECAHYSLLIAEGWVLHISIPNLSRGSGWWKHISCLTGGDDNIILLYIT